MYELINYFFKNFCTLRTTRTVQVRLRIKYQLLLGFFTLHAALGGHYVISVEANIENARRLMKSITLGRLDHRVILFHNAVCIYSIFNTITYYIEYLKYSSPSTNILVL